MSWDDDSDADEYGERRPARAPATGRLVARRAAAYVGLAAGVVALVVGAVFAVNVVGLAADPGGFAAPPANGPRVALPPVITQPEQSEQREQGAQVEEQAAPVEDPTALSGSEIGRASCRERVLDHV